MRWRSSPGFSFGVGALVIFPDMIAGEMVTEDLFMGVLMCVVLPVCIVAASLRRRRQASTLTLDGDMLRVEEVGFIRQGTREIRVTRALRALCRREKWAEVNDEPVYRYVLVLTGAGEEVRVGLHTPKEEQLYLCQELNKYFDAMR